MEMIIIIIDDYRWKLLFHDIFLNKCVRFRLRTERKSQDSVQNNVPLLCEDSEFSNKLLTIEGQKGTAANTYTYEQY